MPLDARDDGKGGVLIAVKAVPGAKRDEIVGLLGNRLKIRISAPPEGGKANKAICALLARELGVRKGDVEVASGAGQAEKSVRIVGVELGTIIAKWSG
jgi:hypothetical protein